MPATAERDALIEKARAQAWFHRIRLAPDFETPGIEDSAATLRSLDAMGLPRNLAGRRVLDVGAMDGFYSFEMERRGAEVVAIDRRDLGTTGFGIAAEMLESRVEWRQSTVYDLDPEDVGTFDVVLCLNAIYHFRHILLGLDRIRSVMRNEADLFVGTASIDEHMLRSDGKFGPMAEACPGAADSPLMQIYANGERDGDGACLYVPNLAGLRSLLRAGEFETLRSKVADGRILAYARAVTIREVASLRNQDALRPDPAPDQAPSVVMRWNKPDDRASDAATLAAVETRPHRDLLFHYSSAFDAPRVIKTFAVPDQQPEPGIIRNFLGTRIEPAVYPPILTEMAGQVEGPPNPANWHADIAEWAAALRSVDLADDTYRIVELGCGWGCWMVNMGVAARSRGLKVDLIGVEGDRHHLANAERTMELNGFGAGDYALHHAIAGPRKGRAIFPDPQAGQSHWGGEPVLYPGPFALRRARRDPGVQVLDVMTLADLSRGGPVDLLHIDIQGGEADYVDGNLAGMSAHVRRVLIGVHGRLLEGRLLARLQQAGWRLEMERPVLTTIDDGRQTLRIDGVQMWANPALT